MQEQWNLKVFTTGTPDFEALALDVFRFQYQQNNIYKNYVDALGVTVSAVTSLAGIPFLPIRFFKTHPVVTGAFDPVQIFESSGTTGSTNSRHYIKDSGLYEQSFL